MERLVTRMGFAMIIIGLLGLSSTAFAQSKMSNDEYINFIRSYTDIWFNGDDCRHNIYGSYYPSEDHFNICFNNMQDYADPIETIKHESIHMIQDCIAGWGNDELDQIHTTEAMLNAATSYSFGMVNDFYTHEYASLYYMLELEAFHYEFVANHHLANLVKQYCGAPRIELTYLVTEEDIYYKHIPSQHRAYCVDAIDKLKSAQAELAGLGLLYVLGAGSQQNQNKAESLAVWILDLEIYINDNSCRKFK